MAADGAGVSGLAARYAAALYDLADESSAIDAVAGDLTALRGLIADSDDFARFIKSPVLTRAEQAQGIEAVAAKAGLNDITRKFLGLLARNRRLFALPAMIDAFLKILAERRGQVSAEVVSATDLSDSQKSSLADSLKKAVGANVAINTTVDPSILGGLIVRVGSRMVDSSIRSKLQRLKLSMKGVG